MHAAEARPGAEVLIVGGGVAGLEALLALRDMAGDTASLTLADSQPDFVYKPLWVEEPFGLGPAEQHELAPLADELGATFVQAGLAAVRTDDCEAELSDGSTRRYDYLLVCVGGRFRPAFEGVTTFPAPEQPRVRVDEVLDRAKEGGTDAITFIVPPGVSWALPLYEIALMTQRVADERGYGELSLEIVTPEPAPLAIFGPGASASVAELLEARGIVFTGSSRAHQEAGSIVLTPGDRELADSVIIALPAMVGPQIEGLPADEDGFLPTDEYGRVEGTDAVYAAGDGTNFPIKQGGIATQQADAAAAHLARRLGAAVEVEPFRPVLRGKLLTGGETLSMRTEVAGGGGEGHASLDALWWPPHKISGRYLAPLLYHGEVGGPEPPPHGLDVEVALPKEWHGEPMATDTD